jgi:tRNA modification GTPase
MSRIKQSWNGVDHVPLETESTICAIATGTQGALRGAIRMSGPESGLILEALFPSLAEALRSARSAQRYPSHLILDQLGELSVDIFYWPDQRSYTGQPSAELHLLGAPVLLEQVQARLLELGATLAKPGEFTLRAYLAGRLDLTQCEAVLGLIHAHSEREFHVALSQLAGGLSGPLKGLRQDLINLLADLEAGLDFVDEDISFVEQDQVILRLEQAEQQVERLRSQIEQRRGQGTEFQVAIIGPPNAGKSSLINALSGSEVSIISSQAGTTRDYVRSRVRWGDIAIDLLDTAGLEEVLGNGPRAIAQERTWEVLGKADLVILCLSVESPIDALGLDSHSIASLAKCSRLWGIWTKSDLQPDWKSPWPVPVERIFTLSVQDRSGLAPLQEALAQTVAAWQQSSLDVVPMTGVRCESALARAAQSLNYARQTSMDRAGDELVAGELRLALEELGQVAGTVANNDVLDALFSRFCIGK